MGIFSVLSLPPPLVSSLPPPIGDPSICSKYQFSMEMRNARKDCYYFTTPFGLPCHVADLGSQPFLVREITAVGTNTCNEKGTFPQHNKPVLLKAQELCSLLNVLSSHSSTLFSASRALTACYSFY